MYQLLIAAAGSIDNMFRLHPDIVRLYLEAVWANGSTGWNLAAMNLAGLPKPTPLAVTPPNPTLAWYHLIYAYMLENTRVYEVFDRVIHHYANGESLDFPNSDAAHWLRTTEALWYRHAAGSAIFNVESNVRPDSRAVRRNAYHRMFGMDLNHGKTSGGPVDYIKAEASNRDFVSTFETFLREVWVGIENRNNAVGANPTDNAAIATAAERLFNMLTTRRRGWNLSREEFYAVALMNWLHVTINDNHPIMVSLDAEASHPRDRLRRAGERVALPMATYGYEYLEMAVPISNLMHALESGAFANTATAPAFYAPGALSDDAATVITHWSSATGRNLKAHELRLASAR
ncbi:MAG: hypothetical protein FJW30_09810 [Acidobacteria bacterium]|nr:hypothetical protein [Acidobacteriota bacterium]